MWWCGECAVVAGECPCGYSCGCCDEEEAAEAYEWEAKDGEFFV